MRSDFRFKHLVIMALCAFAIGCGDDHGHDHDDDHEHDREEAFAEGCEHLTDGPFRDVTASASAAGELPTASTAHTAVVISAADGATEAFVAFEAPADGEYYFFLSADVSLAIHDGSGGAVEVETVADAASGCDAMATAYEADLEVGTYTLTLGVADGESVALVFEALDGDGHGHDD